MKKIEQVRKRTPAQQSDHEFKLGVKDLSTTELEYRMVQNGLEYSKVCSVINKLQDELKRARTESLTLHRRHDVLVDIVEGRR